MWARNRLDGQKRLPRFKLTGIYRLFVDDAKHVVTDADSSSPEHVWQRVAPTGNIYRVNALHAEHLKHQEDLQAQFAVLAVRHAALLDGAASSDGGAPDEAQRRSRLLGLLMAAAVQDDDAEAGNVVAGGGFPPLNEFLCPSGTERHCCGLLLLPESSDGKRAAMKTKLMALLIMVIQILGPVMILLNNWYADTNYLRGGRFLRYMTWEEFACLGPWQDKVVTFMGVLFLILISEVVRNYTKGEMDNMAKLRHLPADTFWHQIGNFTNMTCILFTTLAMPLLFWSEMMPKDIVFDSLGMLFIFTLDDLAGGALGFLELEDAEFQQMSSWMVALLGQCPVKLEDLTDTCAKSAEGIWQIRRSPQGVLCDSDGRPCCTRLAPLRPSESTPLAADNRGDDDECPFEEPAFEYTISPDQPRIRLPGGRFLSQTMTVSWSLLYWLLGALEVILPIIFVTTNKPCTAIA